MSSTYISQPIDENILSVLDVNESGKIVTNDAWTHLWGLVFNRINNIDVFCTTMETLATSWQTTKKTFDEAVVRINEKYAALEQGFVHYGEQAPTDPSTKLWVKPVGDISPDVLATRLFVTESITPVDAKVKEHTAKLVELEADAQELHNELSQTKSELVDNIQNVVNNLADIGAEVTNQGIGIDALAIRAATAESDITQLKDAVSNLDVEKVNKFTHVCETNKLVSITDSANSNIQGLTVYGESTQEHALKPNLLTLEPVVYTQDQTVTTVKADGTIEITGALTGDGVYALYVVQNIELEAGTYYFSGVPNIENFYMACWIYCPITDENGDTYDECYGEFCYSDGLVLTIPRPGRLELVIEEGMPHPETIPIVEPIVFKPHVCVGDNNLLSPDPPSLICPAPIENIVNPVVHLQGENLLPVKTKGSDTACGITLNYNADGSINVIGGTSTNNIIYNFKPTVFDGAFQIIDYNGKVTLSMKNGTDKIYAMIVRSRGNSSTSFKTTAAKPSITFDVLQGDRLYCYIQIAKKTNIQSTTLYLQLEYGTIATSPKPYITPQSVTVPYTLRGIKDAKGNWVARDKLIVDVENNIVKRRVEVGDYTLKPTITWSEWQSGNGSRIMKNVSGKAYHTGTTLGHFTHGIVKQNILNISGNKNKSNMVCAYPESNMLYWYPDWTVMGILDTDDKATADAKLQEYIASQGPIQVTYVLATPTEEDITSTAEGQALLTAVKNLKTNYPTTVVLSAANCSVEYVVDTKNYIDSKFEVLKNVILSLGGNV